jgi:hypothetical protein
LTLLVRRVLARIESEKGKETHAFDKYRPGLHRRTSGFYRFQPSDDTGSPGDAIVTLITYGDRGLRE